MASTDQTLDIINKYEGWISAWFSEKDKGQAQAINKGFIQATGSIVAWINSDDYYWPGIFEQVAEAYQRSQTDRFWAVFAIEHFDEATSRKWVTPQQPANSLDDWLIQNVQVGQQGSFWSRQITERIGLLDEDLHLGLDTEYFMRMVARGYRMRRINEVVAGTFLMHTESKTGNFHGEIVDRDKAFIYDWTLARLRHLPKSHEQYHTLKRQYRNTLAQCEIRFGQNLNSPVLKRLRHLIRAANWSPRSMLGRAFLGSAKRLLVS
ncbi:MAG: glycosyltransferase [Candidatus Competibacteraceae bacterium]